MVDFVKFNQAAEDLAEGVHNLSADTLRVMLTDVAPALTDAVKGDLTEIAAGNGYPAGGATPSRVSAGQSAGVYKLVLADVVFAASGGPIGPFRYAVLYNDTPASPADPLLGYWDAGGEVTVPDGEFFVIDFSAANGVALLY